MPNDDREAAQKKIRSILALVSMLALRLNQWTIFMTKLRAVGRQIDEIVKYVSKTITYPTQDRGKAKLSDDAWHALKLMLDQLDESPLDDLRVPIKSASTVITQKCPVPRDMGDLEPRLIVADLEEWLRTARVAAETDESASNLQDTCEDIQKKILRHTLSCLQQVQHESQSLTTLVKDLESCL
ncbi:MAG: hypothetical protein ACHRXM_01265 [Isosphaerales bacterium]